MRIGLAVVAAAGVALFWTGLWTWFQLDDFMWLGVVRTTGFWAGLGHATAHGTWRPLSEPLVFGIFNRCFGLNAFPYHLLAFATYVLDVFLVGTVAARFGAGRMEALLAAAIFAWSPVLTMPMVWSCSYNQLPGTALFCVFLLAWRRYCTDGRGYAAILSLGAVSALVLETNVTFPVVAAAYVLLLVEPGRRRRLLWRVLPLAGVAGAWCVIHMLHAPPANSGPYRVDPTGSVRALWEYWRWTVLPPLRWEGQAWRSVVPALAGVAVIALLRESRARFFAACYVLLLLPSLILPSHVTDYLLTVPMVGFALMLASLVVKRRAVGWAVAAAYLAVSAWDAQLASRWWSAHGDVIEPVVRGMMALRQRDPVTPIRIYDAPQDLTDFGSESFLYLGLHPVCIEGAKQPYIACAPTDLKAHRFTAEMVARERL